MGMDRIRVCRVPVDTTNRRFLKGAPARLMVDGDSIVVCYTVGEKPPFLRGIVGRDLDGDRAHAMATAIELPEATPEVELERRAARRAKLLGLKDRRKREVTP